MSTPARTSNDELGRESAPAQRAIVALYSADRAGLADAIDDSIVLRDLNPNGLEQVQGRPDVLAVADQTAAVRAKVLRCEARPVGTRTQVTYVVSMVIDGEPGEFEKHAFCDVRDGRVTVIDQVCSGRQARLDG